jgi:uncharacterized protein YcbK (DUF882 family)
MAPTAGQVNGLSLVPANGVQVAATLLPYVQALKDYAARQGWTFRLVSGYRSPTQQAALRAAWDRGDPSVIYPPAQYSYHSLGLAVDVDSNHLADLGAYAKSIGMRWGGDFGDPVHFDLGRS